MVWLKAVTWHHLFFTFWQSHFKHEMWCFRRVYQKKKKVKIWWAAHTYKFFQSWNMLFLMKDVLMKSINNAPTCIEHMCGGLTLASCQTPIQPLSYFPFSTGQGEKVRWKILWVGTRTGRSLTKYIQRQHRVNLGKINLTYSQFEKERDCEKQRQS